jgi:hypothetical protein
VRVPSVVTKCKVMSGAAIGVMAAGSILEHSWMRGWSLLIAVYAVGLCLRSAVDRGAERIKAYVRVWALETFESGFKSGVEQGREMEAAERFIASVEHRR